MDYENRLNRISDNYEKKQKLLLVSHSQLPSAQRIEQSPLTQQRSEYIQPKNELLNDNNSNNSNNNNNNLNLTKGKYNSELWKQEIKEKKMKAELKGFQSIKL